METKQEEKPLTTREKLAIWILFWIVKVVKPSQWTHEYTNEIKKIEELLK